jgi:mannose-1-phosphate guanylyltransferase
MKAIILAAGVGSRLQPLTDNCPKPMLPIAGTPLLAHTIAWLHQQDITDIAINLHHQAHVITNYFGDGQDWGMRIRYSYEPILQGTAGAVRTIAERWPDWIDQDFILLYGDMLLNISLAPLIQMHRQQQALLTLALKYTDTPSSQGMIELNEDNRIIRFEEKPTMWEAGNIANAGVYLCAPQMLQAIPQGISDFGFDIIPKLITNNAAIYGQIVSGILLDIGTPMAYQHAQTLIQA